MTKVFIDGAAGTTGLKIHERLSLRNDIEIVSLNEKFRKDICARKEKLNESDIAFLCLPDVAAREAVEFVENPNTVIIDTSTAHRTDSRWVYGFSELKGQREKIAASKRISNPGCHASGAISLIKPLIDSGALDKSAKLSCFSLTGYSGGGKKMISDYEKPENFDKLKAPSMYGLSQNHKHLPEIQKICQLENAPVFCPVVSSYYSGMQVTVSVFRDDCVVSIEGIKNIYRQYYTTGIVRFIDDDSENGFLSAGKFSGFDDMQISVYGNDDRMVLVSRFDNLGKGACGAAIQNMNICLGIDECSGLNISEV